MTKQRNQHFAILGIALMGCILTLMLVIQPVNLIFTIVHLNSSNSVSSDDTHSVDHSSDHNHAHNHSPKSSAKHKHGPNEPTHTHVIDLSLSNTIVLQPLNFPKVELAFLPNKSSLPRFNEKISSRKLPVLFRPPIV